MGNVCMEGQDSSLKRTKGSHKADLTTQLTARHDANVKEPPVKHSRSQCRPHELDLAADKIASQGVRDQCSCRARDWPPKSIANHLAYAGATCCLVTTGKENGAKTGVRFGSHNVDQYLRNP
jgi:hypothetical protein